MDADGSTMGLVASAGAASDANQRITELEAQVRALEARLAERDSLLSNVGRRSVGAIIEAIDAVESLVLLLDFDGRLLFFNKACADFARLSRDNADGKYIWEMFPDQVEADLAKRSFERLRRDGANKQFVRWARAGTSEILYLEWSSRLIARGGGAPPYVLITGVDVTKHHETREALVFQQRFERLIARVSQSLVSLSAEKLEHNLISALGELAAFLQADACAVWLLREDGKEHCKCYRWHGNASAEKGTILSARAVAGLKSILASTPVVVARGQPLSADLVPLVTGDEAQPVALLALPLICNSQLIGWLSAESHNKLTWAPELVRWATLFGELLAGSLERVRSQQALRQSEERMRAVVESMPVMMCALDEPPDFSSGELVYRLIVWNQECERVTGHRAEELIGNPSPPQLVPSEEYWAQVQAEWRELGDEIQNKEWQIRAKDGTIKTIAWTNMSARVPIPGWGAWGIGVDVTEQFEARKALKRAHDELEARVAARTKELQAANDQLKREIESRRVAEQTLVHQTRILRAILDSIADGIAVADECGEFILFNRSAERMMQIGPVQGPASEWSRVYGLYLPDRQTFYPVDQLPLMRAVRGQESREAIIYVDRPNGPHNTWISVNACPLQDESGQLRGGVAVFRDITESRNAQEQIEREQRLLQQLLRSHERDRQLLAYEIHDGLVQEITGALMHLEAYSSKPQGAADKANPELKRALKLLRITIDEARRVISGLRPPILDEQGIVAAIEYLINEHSIGNVRIRFQQQMQASHLDSLLEGTIYRIVQEALSNIRRHSKASQAEVSLVQSGQRVQLHIRDNGVGFEMAKVVGNRFGLEGMRERARLLHGTARIESQPGAGTSIFINLPIAFRQGNGPRKL